MHISKAMIEWSYKWTDNQEVVNEIKENNNQLKGMSMILKIKTIMARISKSKATKINHEANKCVDTLTKFCFNLYGGNLTFTECHDCFHSLLLGNIRDID